MTPAVRKADRNEDATQYRRRRRAPRRNGRGQGLSACSGSAWRGAVGQAGRWTGGVRCRPNWRIVPEKLDMFMIKARMPR